MRRRFDRSTAALKNGAAAATAAAAIRGVPTRTAAPLGSTDRKGPPLAATKRKEGLALPKLTIFALLQPGDGGEAEAPPSPAAVMERPNRRTNQASVMELSLSDAAYGEVVRREGAKCRRQGCVAAAPDARRRSFNDNGHGAAEPRRRTSGRRRRLSGHRCQLRDEARPEQHDVVVAPIVRIGGAAGDCERRQAGATAPVAVFDEDPPHQCRRWRRNAAPPDRPAQPCCHRPCRCRLGRCHWRAASRLGRLSTRLLRRRGAAARARSRRARLPVLLRRGRVFGRQCHVFDGQRVRRRRIVRCCAGGGGGAKLSARGGGRGRPGRCSWGGGRPGGRRRRPPPTPPWLSARPAPQ